MGKATSSDFGRIAHMMDGLSLKLREGAEMTADISDLARRLEMAEGITEQRGGVDQVDAELRGAFRLVNRLWDMSDKGGDAKRVMKEIRQLKEWQMTRDR